ncbi:unnamed protein product [Lampetra fluviatilis]
MRVAAERRHGDDIGTGFSQVFPENGSSPETTRGATLRPGATDAALGAAATLAPAVFTRAARFLARVTSQNASSGRPTEQLAPRRRDRAGSLSRASGGHSRVTSERVGPLGLDWREIPVSAGPSSGRALRSAAKVHPSRLHVRAGAANSQHQLRGAAPRSHYCRGHRSHGLRAEVTSSLHVAPFGTFPWEPRSRREENGAIYTRRVDMKRQLCLAAFSRHADTD